VVEEKGIYSIEKFLVARRLMYWQVYLHKSVLAADQLLIMMLKRAHDLAMNGTELFATPALSFFLKQPPDAFRPEVSEEFIARFTGLDDNDIISAAKVWSDHEDPVLNFLCKGFINRKLLKIELRNTPFEPEVVEDIRGKVSRSFGISRELTGYIVIADSVANHAYSDMDDHIKILGKDGSVRDIADISEILNVSVLSRKVMKYFLCYPRGIQ
jgi:HD superfamily phosphohydrolase